MEKRPLLSIVVPTKDRYYYLEKLVELIDSFKSDEIEMVIQDNSDDNSNFLEYLSHHNYPFIKYDHKQGQIPMSTNSDLAILNSSGEYVCFIGDDDGVTRYIVDCAKWMKRNCIDAVLPAKVSYFWPDAKKGRVNDNRSTIHFNAFSGKVEFINPLSELYKLINKGFTNRGNIPLVYHGLVSREALNKIFRIGGTFFPGSSPDISNAVSLCFSINKYAVCDIPITISGASKYHGGGTDVLKNKQPLLSEIPWLLPNAEYNWDNRLPKIGIGESIWADSAIKALQYMGKLDLIEKINFENLYATIWLEYPLYRHYLPISEKASIRFRLLCSCKKLSVYIKALSHLILRKLHIPNQYKILYKVSDICIAEERLVSEFNKKKQNEILK